MTSKDPQKSQKKVIIEENSEENEKFKNNNKIKETEKPLTEDKEVQTEEIKFIEKIQTTNEEQQNVNAIPESKKIENTSYEKAYDKNKDFFDNLKPMTNPEAKEESKNYDQKNKGTFNLTENDTDEKKNNYWNKRGRGGRE